MRYSSLLKQCNIIYKTMQQEIENGVSESPDELKCIEWAFSVSFRALQDVEKKVNSFKFLNQQEELYFYKRLKPQFTGLVDYFTLLYKSLLFQPEDYIKRKAYWKCELSTCTKVIYRCKRGCRQYEQQQPASDIYLLKDTNRQSEILGININDFNLTAISYSYLLTRLIAMKKYKKFVQDKINAGRKKAEHYSQPFSLNIPVSRVSATRYDYC
jgi:hypothetical protein